MEMEWMMNLSERLKSTNPAPGNGRAGVAAASAAAAPSNDLDIYHQLKSALHARIVDRLDLETLNRLSPAELKGEIASLVERLVNEEQLPLNRAERGKLVGELCDEMLGLGPLEALLADVSISDILVNGFQTIYIERLGRLQLTGLRFRDNDHLLSTITRIVARVGRRIDESSPMVDARL